MSWEISPGKQFFIDDQFIESLTGARRVLNQPEKLTVHEPLLLRPEKPWEAPSTKWGGIQYDEARQIFFMHYGCEAGGESWIGVLQSEDGVEWRRPSLGLVAFDGSTDNNLTNCPPGGQSLVWDSHATEEAYRWKRIDKVPTGVGPDGQRVWRAFHSADGFDWHPYPSGSHDRQWMLFNFGARGESFGGPVNPDAKYVLYSQRGSGRHTRILGRRDSDDFLNWSGLRTVIDLDLEDPPGTEFYGGASDTGNRTEGGLHVMMLQVFLTDVSEPYEIPEHERYWGEERGPKASSIRMDGFVEPQLAVSRDTVAWKRFRQPFIPRGEPGAWDWGMLFAQAPILHNGRLMFFYQGCPQTHNGRGPQLWEGLYKEGRRPPSKGLAVLRPDGYVSVEADAYAPGILTTHRFRQEPGGTLHVNVDASSGELRYELLDGTGAPLAGYTARDCDPIRSDALHVPLSWQGVARWPPVDARRQAEVPSLPANDFYIKVRFYIAPGTKLYSVTIDPPEVTLWRSQVRGRVD